MAPARQTPLKAFDVEFVGQLVASYVCVLLMMWLFVTGYASRAEVFDGIEAAVGRWLSVSMHTTAVATVGFWGFGTLFSLPALLGVVRGKIQPTKAMDWSALMRSMPLTTFNFAISLPVFTVVVMLGLPASSFDLHAMPTLDTLARDALVFLLAQEFFNYHLHRWAHVDKRLYAAIHKLHHSWTAPVAYTAIYCHPVEHLMVNLLPLFVGPLLCGSHSAAIAGWFFMGLIATTSVHSGYCFSCDHGSHDDHHAKFDVNYGILGLLDRWYGTCQLPVCAPDASARLSPSSVQPVPAS